jgi:hypothetical protein
VEAQHKEFAVHARRSPRRILGHHLKNQGTNLGTDRLFALPSIGLGKATSSTAETQHDASRQQFVVLPEAVVAIRPKLSAAEPRIAGEEL